MSSNKERSLQVADAQALTTQWVAQMAAEPTQMTSPVPQTAAQLRQQQRQRTAAAAVAAAAAAAAAATTEVAGGHAHAAAGEDSLTELDDDCPLTVRVHDPDHVSSDVEADAPGQPPDRLDKPQQEDADKHEQPSESQPAAKKATRRLRAAPGRKRGAQAASASKADAQDSSPAAAPGDASELEVPDGDASPNKPLTARNKAGAIGKKAPAWQAYLGMTVQKHFAEGMFKVCDSILHARGSPS